MRYILFFLYLLFPFCVNADISYITEPFDREKCKNGMADRWDNACKCPNFSEYDGQYCDKKEMKQCKTNRDCPNGSYCYLVNQEGVCHELTVYAPVLYNQKKFFLSGEILNLKSADNLCSALGARSLTREDLACNRSGPGCLDTDTIIHLQEHVGILGFYWLENERNKFYYFDINDGTVYFLDKDSISHMQAICILEEK